MPAQIPIYPPPPPNPPTVHDDAPPAGAPPASSGHQPLPVSATLPQPRRVRQEPTSQPHAAGRSPTLRPRDPDLASYAWTSAASEPAASDMTADVAELSSASSPPQNQAAGCRFGQPDTQRRTLGRPRPSR